MRAYSMLVVFMPSRIEVMRARSATERSAKYSWKQRRGQRAVSESGRGEGAYITFDGLVVVVHGLELERAVRAVDLVDELRDLGGERRRVAGTRRGDLDEDDLLRPLGVVVKEALESAELCEITRIYQQGFVFSIALPKEQRTLGRTPLVGSSLSRPTMIFLPSYRRRRASILGTTPGLAL